MNSYLQKLKQMSLIKVICFQMLIGCCFCSVTVSVSAIEKPEALEYSRLAYSNFQVGNYNEALTFYKKALVINRSMENNVSIYRNLVNLASVFYKLNDNENADKCISEILGELYIQNNYKELYSDAVIIRVLISLRKGQYELAAELIDKGLVFNQNIESNTKGRLYNLKARLAVINNEADNVILYGNKGRELNKKINDQLELANSLRLVGKGKELLNDLVNAKASYEGAFRIDKSYGLNNKMVIDLMMLGKLLFNHKHYGEAADYLRRAISISENSNGGLLGADAKEAPAMLEISLSNVQ